MKYQSSGTYSSKGEDFLNNFSKQVYVKILPLGMTPFMTPGSLFEQT